MPNAAQKASWDGASGQQWAAEAERYDRMNRGFAERIVERLDVRAGARVLDVGCGNGALALAIAPVVDPGTVAGLDLSGAMLENARRRAERAGLANVTFEQGDAEVHPLPPATFDAVVSRFGVMFFDDPVAAFANLARALKPAGRAVFTCWQDMVRNDWIMVPVGAALQHVPLPTLGGPGGPGPFSFADPDRIRQVLHDAGLDDVEITEAVLPMWMGDSVHDAVGFMQHSDMADALMTDVDGGTVARAWAAVSEALHEHATTDGVVLAGAAWLVSASRPR